MTERPDPPRSLFEGDDGGRYSTRVDSEAVEAQRERELNRIGKSDFGNADDETVALLETAREEIADQWDTLDEYIRPQRYDISPPSDDQYDGDTPFDFQAMACAYIYFFCEPEISSWDALTSHLEAHRIRDDYRDIPSNLGFGDDLPHADTLRNTWNDRFHEAFRDHLIHLAHKTVLECREYGIPVSDDAFPTYGTEDEEPDPKDISTAEKQNAIDHIRPMMYDALGFKRAANHTFEKQTMLDLQAEVSREGGFLQQTVEYHWDEGERMPYPTTVFNAIRNRDADEWSGTFESVYERQIQAAKGTGMFDRPVDVYIDATVIPFYVQNDGLPEGVRGGEEKHGTYYGYHHVTISAHDNGRSVLLASYKLTNDDDSTLKDAVQYLIQRAEEFVPIDDVYMDSGFRKTELLKWLDDRGHDFILQYPRQGARLKRKLVTMNGMFDADDYTITSSDRQTSLDLTLLAEPNFDEVESDFTFERSESDGGQLGIGDFSDADGLEAIDLADVDDRLWKGRRPYLTNKDIDTTDTQAVRSAVESYKMRWRIETKYRVIKDEFLGRTTTRNFAVRTFYWLFAAMLYNAWVLLDVLLRADYPDLAPDDRPVMPAKSFARKFLQTDYG